MNIRMRKMLAVAFLLQMAIAQMSGAGNAAMGGIPVQSADASGEAKRADSNPENMYISKVMEAAKGESVVKSYVEDFEMNGKQEAFILTKKRVNKRESKFSLWFVSDTECRALQRNVLALKGTTLQLIRNKTSIHVLFRTMQFTMNQYVLANIYGVSDGKPEILFQKDTILLDIRKNRIYGTEKQYCYYDANLKGLTMAAFVDYEFFWNEQEEKYMEYGAVLQTKKDFLQYSGAKKIWRKLKKKAPGKNKKVHYTFLKRANGTIDINMKISFKRDYWKTYVTLSVEDGRVFTKKLRIHDGNKKRCKYPEMGSFE